MDTQEVENRADTPKDRLAVCLSLIIAVIGGCLILDIFSATEILSGTDVPAL